jgi:hypothetical protein
MTSLAAIALQQQEGSEGAYLKERGELLNLPHFGQEENFSTMTIQVNFASAQANTSSKCFVSILRT